MNQVSFLFILYFFSFLFSFVLYVMVWLVDCYIENGRPTGCWTGAGLGLDHGKNGCFIYTSAGYSKGKKSWPTRKEMGDERFLYYIEKRGNSTHTHSLCVCLRWRGVYIYGSSVFLSLWCWIDPKVNRYCINRDIPKSYFSHGRWDNEIFGAASFNWMSVLLCWCIEYRPIGV